MFPFVCRIGFITLLSIMVLVSSGSEPNWNTSMHSIYDTIPKKKQKKNKGIQEDTIARPAPPTYPPVGVETEVVAVDSMIVDSEPVYVTVEVNASVDRSEWRRHLELQLVDIIMKAAMEGMKDGVYTVKVRFIVEKDGSITNVQALNNPGHGLAEGAIRVVKTGPKWTPAQKKNKKVRSYYTQPITFVIETE